MIEPNIKQLALVTLSGKTMFRSDSCFMSHEAGDTLVECGPDALPVIEEIIRSEVNPILTGNDLPLICEPFLGLGELLGVYLRIAVRTDSDHVYRFLEQQPEPTRVAAIKSASTHFFKTNNGYNFGVAPNSALIEFVRRQIGSNSTVSQHATDVYRQLTKQLAS